MQSSLPYRDTSYTSLGERRRKSDLARFSLDLSWAGAASGSAHSRAYPSPPMSDSPPLPPRRNLDSSDRSHGSYGSGGQEVYPDTQTPRSKIAGEGGQAPRAYQSAQHPPTSYPPYGMEVIQPGPPLSYPQRGPQISQHLGQQQHPAYLPQVPQQPATFSTPERSSTGDPSEYDPSPKTQRKTKGHVASACVPCKRAHLRCDAQRPCSRCLANGKEEACIDVQHKKRGRPRLRDERDQRYESYGPGYPHRDHESSIRRPISSYSPEALMVPAFGEPQNRSGSYRILKSQGSLAPRHLEHASSADANVYGGSMIPAPRMMPQEEPLCAYLTMDMQIAKVTRTFSDAVGSQAMVSRGLQDIVSANDREKIERLHRIFEEQRRNREPTYLPPIFPKFEENRMIQSVGFGPEELAQLQLDHQELLSFPGPEGQQRIFQARFGLSKKDSTYFIAVIFQVPVPATPQAFHHASPSSYVRDQYGREPQYGYDAPQPPFPPNRASSSFIPNQPFSDPREGSMMYRPPGPLGMSAPMPASMPSFSRAQTVPDYSSQSRYPYQAPRSEVSQGQPQRQQDLQLPPIRGQRGEGRNDRSSRVDIGGLLEQPRTSGGR